MRKLTFYPRSEYWELTADIDAVCVKLKGHLQHQHVVIYQAAAAPNCRCDRDTTVQALGKLQLPLAKALTLRNMGI